MPKLFTADNMGISKSDNDRLPIVVIVDNVRSLYNVGSLFRLADGLNIEGLFLCGISGYPLINDDPRPHWIAERADKEIRKTGLAGVENVPFRYFETTEAAVKAAQEAGYQVIALELTESSADYRTAEYHFPLAVIIGHETDGVAPDLLKNVDLAVHLPMRGAGKSLNVATASAALLYYLFQRYEV